MVHEFGRIKTGSVVADVETTETSQMIPRSSGHKRLKEASPVSCVVKTSAFVRGVCVCSVEDVGLWKCGNFRQKHVTSSLFRLI